MKANLKLKEYAKKKKVFLWQLADELGVSVETLNRRTRHELPENTQKEYMKLIDKVAKREGK